MSKKPAFTSYLKYVFLIICTLFVGFTLALFLSKNPAPQAETLISLNEGYGTANAVHDTVGTVSAGSITGATWKSEEFCKFDKCLYFDGSSSFVSIPDNSNLDMLASDTVTVEGWFKVTGTAATVRTIASKQAINSAGYSIAVNASNYLTFSIDDDNSWTPDDIIISNTTVNDFDWHFFAAVKNGTSSISLYLDGVLQASKTPTASGSLGNALTFILGNDNDGLTPYDGFIDEIKISRSARTSTEIKADFVGETPSRGVAASFNPDTSYLNNGLVGYWKLNESSSGAGAVSRVDSSGNQNTLTDSNTTPSTIGKYGDSANVTFANNESLYITNANQHGLNITGSISVCAWFNHTTNANLNTIAAKFNITGNQQSYRLSTYGTRQIFFTVSPDGSTTYDGNTNTNAFSDSTWVHTCATYNGSQIQIYINGTQYSGGTLPFTYSGGIFNSNANFNISDHHNSDYFSGNIDEVRIYNRALSALEVQKIYNWSPDPLGWWKFDENTGSSAYDTSGNQYTGSFTGSPTWTAGKFGSSLSFNGSSQAVTATIADPGYSNTIEAWIYPTSSIASKTIITATKLVTNASSQPTYGSCTGTAISLNTWTHLVATSSDSTHCAIYQNGVLTASSATTGVTFGTSVNIAASSFIGIIDDVKIYNYPRTSTQIIQDLNGGHPAPGSPVGSAIGQWNFDEGFGDTLNNSGNCGSTCNLTRSGATKPSWSNSGKFDKALNFGGTAAYLAAASDVAPFKITGDLTLSAWINLTNTSSQHDIICKYTGTASTSAYCLTVNSSGKLQMLIVNSSGPSVVTTTSTSTLSTSTWYHVSGVFKSSSSVSLYINGNLDVKNITSIPTSLQNPTTILDIGAENAGSNLMNGFIDDPKIFTSALSSDQIKADFNHGSSQVLGSLSTNASITPSWSDNDKYCPPGQGTSCTPPVGLWKFDENTGSTAYDTGSSISDLTLSNTSWQPGKIGNSVKFNSTASSYGQTSDNATLSLTSSLTLSAWIKPSSITASTLFGIATKGTDYALVQYGDEIRMYIGSSSNYATTNSTNLAVNTWYYVAGVYNASAQTVSLYVNGQLQAATVTGSIPASISDSTSAFNIGLYNDGTSGTVGPIAVSASSDDADANNFESNPAVLTGNLLEFGQVGAASVGVGTRFNNITIPNGATITSATFTAYCNATDTTNAKVKLAAQAADNAATFTTTGNDLSTATRSRTSYTSTWNMPDCASAGSAQSTSITSQVQAVINRAGWVSGNSIVIFVENDASGVDTWLDMYSWDHATGAPPEITISYTSSTPYYYNGLIDDTKLYNYARTPAQIAWDFNRSSPQGWWKLDENTGTTAYDSSNNGYNSDTFVGNTAYTTGKLNYGLTFDGTNDVVTIVEGNGVDFGATTDSYSVSAWFKTTTDFSSNPGAILAKDDGSGVYPFSLQISTAELPCILMNDGTTRTLCGTSTVNDGNWHQLTAVRDVTTDTVTLYLDAVKINSQTDPTTATMANDDKVSIGNSGAGTYQTNDFNGQIDDVRIYNYPLNPTQVKLLLNSGNATRF